MTTEVKPKAGLEDVVAAASAICYLDGERGVLAYFGYDIHDLARGASFEEVCHLLWPGRPAIRVAAQMGSIVATYGRMQAGGGPIAPDPALGHAANFLYMLTGNRPNALSTRAFDLALGLHAQHERNAS